MTADTSADKSKLGETEENPEITQNVASMDIPDPDTSLTKVIYAVSLSYSLLAIYYIRNNPFTADKYVTYHLLFTFLLFTLVEIYHTKDRGWNGLRDKVEVASLTGLTAGAFFDFIYIISNYDELAFGRFRGYPAHEIAIGVIIILAALISMYRAYGLIIASVAIFAILYALYGPIFPSIFEHSGIEPRRLVTFVTLEFEAGVYGLIVRIGATWIFIFLIWAGLVESYGGIETFINIGFFVGSKFRSGVPQTAIVSSMIMGSISGSPMANSVVTGSFTIPMMKERGLSAKHAGSIEAVASTGGMILPPVMGAVAFLMASFLGVSYGYIIVAAALPALLFYISLAFSIHLMTISNQVEASITKQVNKTQIVIDAVPILASVIGLVYFLVILRLTPDIGGLYTIVVLIVAEATKRIFVGGSPIKVAKLFISDTVDGIRTGGIRMLPIAIVLAGIGILISSFSRTGLGFRLSSAIITVSAGVIVVLLILVLLTSLFLGLGMPTVAAYLLVISLVAPALVDAGFAEITAHFFVFYYAMLASITPPIALTCAVTCKIAEENFLTVALESVKLGLPLFLLPLLFTYNESLLLLDGVVTAVVFVIVLSGLLTVSYGLYGPLPLSKMKNNIVRVLLVTLGAAVGFLPHWIGLN